MIAVSYLKSKYEKLKTIKLIEDSDADLIHVDLMDGLYVGNKNFTTEELVKDLSDTKKLLDIHLMVLNPEEYIEELSQLNCYLITFHLNTTKDNMNVINLIKKYNIKVGIAINPTDDINMIDKYLDFIDYVLVMSVNPGMGGQTFIKDTLKNIEYLQDKNVLIGIDGGINEDTIKYLDNYKIDIIISGSYICMSDNYNERINKLKNFN